MTREMLDTIKHELAVAKIGDMMCPPRTAQGCPVHAIKVNGNGDRLAYIVENRLGQIVEVVQGGPGEDVEQRFHRRWPWYSTEWAERFGILNNRMVWPTIVNVENKEFNRLVNLEPWAAEAAKLRGPADRRERWAVLTSTVSAIYGSQFKSFGIVDRSDTVTVYHRLRRQHGSALDEWLHGQMGRLVKLGAIEREGDPKAIMPNGKTPVGEVVGLYRPTDLTPNPHKLNR